MYFRFCSVFHPDYSKYADTVITDTNHSIIAIMHPTLSLSVDRSSSETSAPHTWSFYNWTWLVQLPHPNLPSPCVLNAPSLRTDQHFSYPQQHPATSSSYIISVCFHPMNLNFRTLLDRVSTIFMFCCPNHLNLPFFITKPTNSNPNNTLSCNTSSTVPLSRHMLVTF